MMTETFYTHTVSSPIGELRLVASDKGLRALLFPNAHNKLEFFDAIPDPLNRFLKKAEAQLAEYFAGKRREFDIPLDMQGTVFQIKAWKELQKIPYGTTISYSEQASRVGDSNKARPVGAANGRNPLAIIVPCHRVIGSNGSLVGFGGGLPTKEFLLGLEQKYASASSRAA